VVKPVLTGGLPGPTAPWRSGTLVHGARTRRTESSGCRAVGPWARTPRTATTTWQARSSGPPRCTFSLATWAFLLAATGPRRAAAMPRKRHRAPRCSHVPPSSRGLASPQRSARPRLYSVTVVARALPRLPDERRAGRHRHWSTPVELTLPNLPATTRASQLLGKPHLELPVPLAISSG
jgi:hypothetical protein